jgi:hypothetical protein
MFLVRVLKTKYIFPKMVNFLVKVTRKPPLPKLSASGLPTASFSASQPLLSYPLQNQLIEEPNSNASSSVPPPPQTSLDGFYNKKPVR